MAVHQDLVPIRVCTLAQMGGLAVHRHPSGDQICLCRPPGANPRGGQQLLQSFFHVVLSLSRQPLLQNAQGALHPGRHVGAIQQRHPAHLFSIDRENRLPGPPARPGWGPAEIRPAPRPAPGTPPPPAARRSCPPPPGAPWRSCRFPPGPAGLSGPERPPAWRDRWKNRSHTGRVVRPVVAVLESHRHQPLAVSLHTAHQRPACRHGIAGLQADTPLYLVQQLVVVGHGPPANGDAAGGGHPYQSLIFHRRAGKTRHVPGRGVMVLMVQPRWGWRRRSAPCRSPGPLHS